MSCCHKHDRMDLTLGVSAFLDAQCGTPTLPDGEQRYCCRQCPAVKEPLRLLARWAGNPNLMRFLTIEEQTQVMSEAIRLGPLHIDIRSSVPLQADNAVTSATPTSTP